MAWIGNQPFHLGGDRRQLGDAKVDQRVLENRELSAAEIAQHILLAASGQRGEDADEVVGFGTRFESLFVIGSGRGKSRPSAKPWLRIDAPKSLLNFCAMSRDSSRCCFWSSPTGTWVAR